MKYANLLREPGLQVSILIYLVNITNAATENYKLNMILKVPTYVVKSTNLIFKNCHGDFVFLSYSLKK